MDLQEVIDNHSKAFGEMPKGLPLDLNRDHVIHLQPRSVPLNGIPYRYPCAQKIEHENTVQEMLDASII